MFLRLTIIVSRIWSWLDSLHNSYAFCSSRRLLKFSLRSVIEALDYLSKWLTSKSVSARSLALAACLLLLNFAFWNEVKLTIWPNFYVSVFSGSKLFSYIFLGELLASSCLPSCSIVMFLLNSSSNLLYTSFILFCFSRIWASVICVCYSVVVSGKEVCYIKFWSIFISYSFFSVYIVSISLSGLFGKCVNGFLFLWWIIEFFLLE